VMSPETLISLQATTLCEICWKKWCRQWERWRRRRSWEKFDWWCLTACIHICALSCNRLWNCHRRQGENSKDHCHSHVSAYCLQLELFSGSNVWNGWFLVEAEDLFNCQCFINRDQKSTRIRTQGS
jgi:hypothetical protein